MAMDECNLEQQNSSDEILSPVAKMKKYSESDNVFDRQTVVCNVLETMRSVANSQEDIDTIVEILVKLSEDIEPGIRAELMEQIPHIVLMCHECGGRLFQVAFQVLLPVVAGYLQDTDNQVRKTSQAALLMLLEQDLVNKEILQDQVCPIILRLSDKENFDDYRTEAVALMSKMAPLIGREITEDKFLKTFANLCVDGLYQVRQVCAANFGDFCTVIGTETTEKILLSRFSNLCEDGVWNVRKACADVFTTVSYNCTSETRHNQLSSLFVNLLCDQSRWVRLAAFQALGPFISTFADPSQTGLYFNEDGMRIVRDNSFYEIDERKDGECVTVENNVKEDALTNKEDPANCTRENCDREEISEESECTKSVVACSDLNAESETRKVGGESEVDVRDSLQITGTSETMKMKVKDEEDKIDDDDKCSKIIESDCPMQNVSDGEINDNASTSSELKDCWVESKIMESELSSKECLNQVGADGLPSDAHAQLTLSDSSPSHLHVHLDDSAFNSFRYWRIPISDVELDIDILEGKPTNVNVRAKLQDGELNLSLGQSSHSHTLEEKRYVHVDSPRPVSYTRSRTASAGGVQEVTLLKSNNDNTVTSSNEEAKQCVADNVKPKTAEQMTSFESLFDSLSVEINARKRFDTYPLNSSNNVSYARRLRENREIRSQIVQQNIVPSELLEHYVSMRDLSQAETVDNEIARYCAYSLPAVAMTLGRKNWPILKQLYESLASDMQWKVRHTIASSIHEVAMILGEDLANKDLVPIFNGFIKDLDEVRIGILHHIADFFKLLNPEERREYLPKLCHFLRTDNERNWRFRLELTEQLAMLASLYQPGDIREYLMPIAILLIADRVAEVRQVAVRIVCILVREVSSVSEPSLVKSFLAELAEQFAHHKKWTRRQTFVSLCNHIVNENSLTLQQFAHDLLPHLLDLSYDAVPNVRLSVAKTLSQTIIPLEYYSSHHNPYHELLVEVLRRLQTDHDRDVRYYANLAPQNSVLMSSVLPSAQLVLPV